MALRTFLRSAGCSSKCFFLRNMAAGRWWKTEEQKEVYIKVHTATRWTIKHSLMLLWFAEGLLLSRVETKDRFWDIFSKESEVSDFLALSLLRTNITSLPSHYHFFFFFFLYATPFFTPPPTLLLSLPLHRRVAWLPQRYVVVPRFHIWNTLRSWDSHELYLQTVQTRKVR